VKEMLEVVKCLSFSPSIARRLIATEIERLRNLRHSLIARLLGFLFPVESRGWCGFEARAIARDWELSR
jgi:hypothetical protein